MRRLQKGPQTSGAGAAVRDADVSFFMSLHRDHERADATLRELRRHYPESRIVARSDGDPDPRHRGLAGRYGVDYREEVRLFPVANGGALVARALEILLERPTPYLFKIDPDAAVHRRFRFLPGRSGHFGTLQTSGSGATSVQGGCMGFTRDAAERFASSGLLADPRLREPDRHRDLSPFWPVLARRAALRGLASFDWTLGWAAGELGIELFDFPEVHCTWRSAFENPDLRYAITHGALTTRTPPR